MPTIFSLAEDALNNVPSAYAEASEALGASRLQTAFRVMVPAAFSGILAAVLLGLGRVIGETMVVLLVAGNRISTKIARSVNNMASARFSSPRTPSPASSPRNSARCLSAASTTARSS